MPVGLFGLTARVQTLVVSLVNVDDVLALSRDSMILPFAFTNAHALFSRCQARDLTCLPPYFCLQLQAAEANHCYLDI